ncbi:hypothetical protein GO613_14605 [Azoarcus communis]|uniref:Uncharacterized protein n=1 Tax=Parazoarcus communis SWub3 = DSM 12120 TaxID=1121029 RepID=A0A323UYP8_9RHOO|nr:hypothetical protein [Parazoarcus communis]NMG49325.1 hypothetical protein [Parazoarcus communis]PZA17351.1 hypothetical protein DNK49_05660 [Azoarcus communis] [Parazoarcus communis SWub3 = DSM 12120]
MVTNASYQMTCADIEEAATDILTLIEGLDPDSYARSRLTRTTVAERLRRIARHLALLPAEAREAMPELDWGGWSELYSAMQAGQAGVRQEWTAASEMAVLVLQWMRVYRQPA